MSTFHPSRRSVLAGSAAAVAVVSVPAVSGRAQAAAPTKVSSCRASHTLGFGKAARGASYPALYMAGAIESFNAVYRSDDKAKTWTRINDDQHQWGWAGTAITGDPRVRGRVYLATNGRGVQHGEPA